MVQFQKHVLYVIWWKLKKKRRTMSRVRFMPPDSMAEQIVSLSQGGGKSLIRDCILREHEVRAVESTYLPIPVKPEHWFDFWSNNNN